MALNACHVLISSVLDLLSSPGACVQDKVHNGIVDTTPQIHCQSYKRLIQDSVHSPQQLWGCTENSVMKVGAVWTLPNAELFGL